VKFDGRRRKLFRKTKRCGVSKSTYGCVLMVTTTLSNFNILSVGLSGKERDEDYCNKHLEMKVCV